MKNYPLRLPLEIHEQIQELAKEDERSVNMMFIRLLRLALENKHKFVSSFYAQTLDSQESQAND